MINILIANDNIYYSKEIMDIINSENVKICNLSISGEETLNILNNKDDIDIILLKLELPKYSGIQVIDMLSDIKKEQYKDSCILFSKENNKILKRVEKHKMVHEVIEEGHDINQMLKSINELVENKKREKDLKEIKNLVYEELKKLNYNIAHKGTQYLIDIITLIYVKDMLDIFNLKRDIYPKIAEKYGVPTNLIKGNIYTATDYMNINCEIEQKKKYFHFQDDSKPTVKNVICTVINNIRKNIDI